MNEKNCKKAKKNGQEGDWRNTKTLWAFRVVGVFLVLLFRKDDYPAIQLQIIQL